MHWIERTILQTLLRIQIASAKHLIPEGVEANLASHYLRRLMSQGLVYKVDRGKYTLTSEGERFVGEMNSISGKVGKNLKTVIMLYAENSHGSPLLFTWTRQPYLSQITLPHDRVAYETSLEDALKNALIEKLGKEYPATFIASGFVKIYQNKVATSHMSAFLYKVSVDEKAFPFESKNGVASFEYNRADAMKGVDQLISIAQNNIQEVFDTTLQY
jgi:predicted transcriptional regulator